MLESGFHAIPKGHLATVVTHLQMTAHPALSEVAAPADLTLVEHQSFALEPYRKLFRAVGEDYLWFSRLNMPDDALTAILTDPNYKVFSLQKDGVDLALLELDFRQPNECELAFFGLHADLIGQGAGRYLMNQACEIAWSRSINRFHVHTCTLDSAQALPFYTRSGFEPYKQEVEIAPDPRLTGKIRPDAAPQIPLID
ncbi:MAG: GNAT family N-acetyltransferase [Pseudomonadota bacterium]|nr:GNAT family N-acetyltransferase [Pseudomonadota bacterium]